MRGVAGRLRRASRAQRLGWVPAAAARKERSEGSNDRRNGQGQDGHRAPLVAEQRIVRLAPCGWLAMAEMAETVMLMRGGFGWQRFDRRFLAAFQTT